MKSIPQIEKEINRQLDIFYKIRNNTLFKIEIRQSSVLAYINGMGFVLGQKERMQISEKTRERLLKATKEFRNGQK
jgi:hypothetical protein